MAITDGYTTLAEVKAILRITDDVDDALLETCVEAASRQIETHCERVFLPTTATRVFTPDGSYVVSIDDLSETYKLSKTSSDCRWKLQHNLAVNRSSVRTPQRANRQLLQPLH